MDTILASLVRSSLTNPCRSSCSTNEKISFISLDNALAWHEGGDDKDVCTHLCRSATSAEIFPSMRPSRISRSSVRSSCAMQLRSTRSWSSLHWARSTDELSALNAAKTAPRKGTMSIQEGEAIHRFSWDKTQSVKGHLGRAQDKDRTVPGHKDPALPAQDKGRTVPDHKDPALPLQHFGISLSYVHI
jgi:hypothetical protein